MHNNFYLLRKLAQELHPLLKGGIISECFSQNKEELIVRIELGVNSFYIKANLQPAFSCLSFPTVFHRAKKNSVDLFAEIIGLPILSVHHFSNERSIALELNQGYQVLFKLHGNRSNCIVFKDCNAVSLFRNNLEADSALKIDKLDRQLDWSEEAFNRNRERLKQHYFTLGNIVWKTLSDEGFFEWNNAQQWARILRIKEQLENPTYSISRWGNSLVLSLLKTNDCLIEEQSPLKALTIFSSEYLQTEAFYQEKSKSEQQLMRFISQADIYIGKIEAKLLEIEHDQHYKIWADLLMANLHQVKPAVDSVVLPNFYDNNKPLEITLKRELSPQKNAEVYYRKSKNKQIELDRLRKNSEEKTTEKTNVEIQLARIKQANNLKELRLLTQQQKKYLEKKEITTPLPYHEFIFMGYSIWVGRNAQANDLLTLKHTFKEDLWLHAKDVAGSHVVIKHQAGKVFPKEVIERGAQLAAYNSKRKTESLAPVAYTSKKYVRKRKGDPAGMVVVEREEVILVEPKLTTDEA